MRIRKSYLPPPALSSRSPIRLPYSDDDRFTFDRSPHVMISRINGCINKIESTSLTFNKKQQDQGIVLEEEEEEEEEEMESASANQSSSIGEGWWREEEKAVPFKKRRVIRLEEEEEESDDTERDKMVKGEADLIRCGRMDERCSRTGVEGYYSTCEHHLLTRSARYGTDNLEREIFEEGDHKKKKKKERELMMEEEMCSGKCENEVVINSNNNININKRKLVKKARSINSLVRDTVPLMRLNL